MISFPLFATRPGWYHGRSQPPVPFGTAASHKTDCAGTMPYAARKSRDDKPAIWFRLQSVLVPERFQGALQTVVNVAVAREVRQCFKLRFAQVLESAQEERLDLESRLLIGFVAEDVSVESIIRRLEISILIDIRILQQLSDEKVGPDAPAQAVLNILEFHILGTKTLLDSGDIFFQILY